MSERVSRRTMPEQKPGRSVQTYATPRPFLCAAAAMLRIQAFAIDLAASRNNTVSPVYFTEADNALACAWPDKGWCWLNPPFGRLAPWVEKCDEARERGVRVAALLPASVGSNWYARHVHGKAFVLFLRPRLTFVGETAPYPKDLMLCLYDGPRVGSAVWDWRNEGWND